MPSVPMKNQVGRLIFIVERIGVLKKVMRDEAQRWAVVRMMFKGPTQKSNVLTSPAGVATVTR